MAKYYHEILQRGKFEYDDHAISTLALISMYQTITFLILQLLINIPLVIILLYMEYHDYDKESKDLIMLTFFIILEVILIIFLITRGKKKFDQYIDLRLNPNEENSKVKAEFSSPPFTEKTIELSIYVTAAAGLGWCSLIGINKLKSVSIMLSVVEGSAILFLLIFLITRFIITKKIRLSGVLCLALALTSFVSLILHF